MAYTKEVNGKKVVISDSDITKDFASIDVAATGRLIHCGEHVHYYLAEDTKRKAKDFAKAHKVTETQTSQAHQVYQASKLLPWLIECTANAAKAWGKAIAQGRGGKEETRGIVEALEVTFKKGN